MLKELFEFLRKDDLLNQAWSDSHTMLKAGQEMMRESMRVLREEDKAEVDPEIRRKDKMVNEYERDVRRKVMTHCAVRGPAALSNGMVLISIVIDIERIGDYSKNIMDLAVTHSGRLDVAEFSKKLKNIENAVTSRFQETIEVLESQDEERARELLDTYKEEVGRACDAMVDQIVTGKVKSLAPADAATMVLYVRYLKRIGAHLKNVTTSVVNPVEWIGYGKVKNE
jgi:phosphate transport system protein